MSRSDDSALKSSCSSPAMESDSTSAFGSDSVSGDCTTDWASPQPSAMKGNRFPGPFSGFLISLLATGVLRNFLFCSCLTCNVSIFIFYLHNVSSKQLTSQRRGELLFASTPSDYVSSTCSDPLSLLLAPVGFCPLNSSCRGNEKYCSSYWGSQSELRNSPKGFCGCCLIVLLPPKFTTTSSWFSNEGLAVYRLSRLPRSSWESLLCWMLRTWWLSRFLTASVSWLTSRSITTTSMADPQVSASAS